MKKTIKFFVIVALFFGLTLSNLSGGGFMIANAAETVGKDIDMYLIGGQSNAVGYSSKGNLTESFSNIGYAGAVDRQLTDGVYGANNTSKFADFKWTVTPGLGANSNRIGPEYGMAKVFKQRMGDTRVFIFKAGAGGTALRDINSGLSSNFGNWYPRSLWHDGYTPCEDSDDPTGVQYYMFVENFRNVYTQLKANGYNPIVKGMAWMQGCDDLGYDKEYESLIKTFICDIRTDLSEITGTNLSQMPFVIGKIATTFGSYNNSNVPAFNEMQQRVADSMTNVATIETSDLIIVNEDDSINGTDQYHFNTQDAVTLGERFGKKLMEYAKRSVITIQPTKNGSVAYEYDAEGKLTFSFKPNKNYKFNSVLLNGSDVTNEVTENRLVLSEFPSEIELTVTFAELDKYNFTYDDLSKYGGMFLNKASYCYVGNKLRVKIKMPDGYNVISVKLGENELTLDAKGEYYEIIPAESGHISVEVKKIGGESSEIDSGSDNNQSGESGCDSSLNGTPIIGSFLLAASGFFFTKKKNIQRR